MGSSEGTEDESLENGALVLGRCEGSLEGDVVREDGCSVVGSNEGHLLDDEGFTLGTQVG